MKAGSIKITVVIPVYNSEKYLNKCLNSVIEQTYPNWEAIIIDDASTDNSIDIIKDYAKRDSRIRFYSHDSNKGPGFTRNEAIKYAIESHSVLKDRGRELCYLVFLDSDDWVEKEYFQNIALLARQERPDVIFVDIVQEDVLGTFIKHERISTYKDKTKDEIIKHQMTGKLPWGGVRKVIKTNLIIENNLRYSDNAIGEEALYSFKLLYFARKLSFLEESFYHYVIHTNSQSGKYDEDPYGPICDQIKEYLLEINEYDNYKKTLNSFAFTALTVSIYRYAQYYSLMKATKLGKLRLKKFIYSYDFGLDKSSLEYRVRIILPFARLNLVIPIVMISKIKNSLASRNKW